MELGRYIVRFIKSPIDTISNPPHLGKVAIMTIAALQGVVLWLCMFFILRGGGVGPLKILTSLMNFNGGAGYSLVLQIILCMVSGAISGVILFFLYSGIFWLINRFVMRLKTAYWEFSIRLAVQRGYRLRYMCNRRNSQYVVTCNAYDIDFVRRGQRGCAYL